MLGPRLKNSSNITQMTPTHSLLENIQSARELIPLITRVAPTKMRQTKSVLPQIRINPRQTSLMHSAKESEEEMPWEIIVRAMIPSTFGIQLIHPYRLTSLRGIIWNATSARCRPTSSAKGTLEPHSSPYIPLLPSTIKVTTSSSHHCFFEGLLDLSLYFPTHINSS